MKIYNECGKCGRPKPTDDAICEHCASKFDSEQGAAQVKADKSTANLHGLMISVPVAMMFIFMSSVTESLNTAFIVVGIILFVVALPWSLVTLIIMLYAVPMNTGLHPNMDGYSWRIILAYSAPLITVFGAHFNAYKLSSSFLRRRRMRNYV